MRVTTLFHDLPLWAIYIVTVLVILLSAEVGYRVGNWRSRSGSREKEAPIGGLVGATLGLLAFALVTLIIVDLDRPQSGLIQVSQQPLLDLLDKMGAAAP